AVTPLAWDPEDSSPSDLLRPRHAVVPLVGRQSLLDQLMLWRESDAPLGVVVIAGPGGAGKTRLALEVCAAAERGGWTAGPLARRALKELFGTGDAREDLATILQRAEIVRLDTEPHELDRTELFAEACSAFRPRVGKSHPPPTTPSLRADHFARPLMVLTAAL